MFHSISYISTLMQAVKQYVEPKADSEGAAWTWTHYVECSKGDDCATFPVEACDLKTQRDSYKILGGGFGLETCPTTGRLHQQGWLLLDKNIRFKALKKFFCGTIHWEKMGGTIQENITYCSKEGQYQGFGDQEGTNPHPKKGQGQRNDIALVCEQIMKGTSLKRVATDNPVEWVKFHKGFESLRTLTLPEFEGGKREFHVLWGDAGAGKSWRAMQLMGVPEGQEHRLEEYAYIPEQNNSGVISFENYSGQKWIFLDDFEPKSLPVTVLKRMTDRYSCVLPGRGRSVTASHMGVVITCNYKPENWYTESVDYRALLRRMETLLHCTIGAWTNCLTGEVTPNPCPHVAELQVPNFNPNFLL